MAQTNVIALVYLMDTQWFGFSKFALPDALMDFEFAFVHLKLIFFRFNILFVGYFHTPIDRQTFQFK